MLRRYLNFRTALTILALAIVTGTIFYSDFLSKKIEKEEREKISQWVEASKFIASAPQGVDITLASQIQQQNDDIPVIWTNEKDSIIDFRNIDSTEAQSKTYIEKKLKEFQNGHPPIVLVLNQDPYVADKYYYGDSKLLKQIRYFPIIQLLVVAMFIILVFYGITVRNKSTQNQVWAGMAKETAHQLGTPLSSLQGWIEMLKDKPSVADISLEMEKDIDRLKLISDRFGKIGSTPQLEENDVVVRVKNMLNYMKRLAPERIRFDLQSPDEPLVASISPPLFDWVIENLLKNALDALGGKGKISIQIKKTSHQVFIDISDTGKGISKQHLRKIFIPGYTTKKRGWGLGLSLCKRIIEQYHKGQLFVKNTEIGKGTTFRIVLNA